MFFCIFCNFENVFRQKLIKQVAGEARDPSRKMRKQKTVNISAGNHFLRLIRSELWRFTETHKKVFKMSRSD